MTAAILATYLMENWVEAEMVEVTDDDEALFSLTVDGELWDVTVKRVEP